MNNPSEIPDHVSGPAPRTVPRTVSAREIEAMAAYGIPSVDIARIAGIDSQELQDRYAEELATARSRANSRVAESLYRKALGDGPQSVSAAIFWLKSRAHWRETAMHEISGPGGAPIETELTVRFV